MKSVPVQMIEDDFKHFGNGEDICRSCPIASSLTRTFGRDMSVGFTSKMDACFFPTQGTGWVGPLIISLPPEANGIVKWFDNLLSPDNRPDSISIPNPLPYFVVEAPEEWFKTVSGQDNS